MSSYLKGITLLALSHLDTVIEAGEVENNTALAIRNVERALSQLDQKLGELEVREIEMLTALQTTIGHSSCYCSKCKAAEAEYWRP